MNAPILPAAVIGILGGGQLGRMTALAARAMGYRVHVLDPDPDCAAAPVVDRVISAPFDDARAAAGLARECAVVTFEIEKIAPTALAAVAELVPLRPSAKVLHVVQDRVRQKRWLDAAGFPVGPFREARDEAEFVLAVEAFGGRVFAKSSFGGYDGRGQATLDEDGEGRHREALLAGTEAGTAQAASRRAESARAAWRAVGEGPCVVEDHVVGRNAGHRGHALHAAAVVEVGDRDRRVERDGCQVANLTGLRVRDVTAEAGRAGDRLGRARNLDRR
ncbi:MAG: hypothetical protein ABIP29_08115, partial [Candidatus Eisenbacteria bacterium]